MTTEMETLRALQDADREIMSLRGELDRLRAEIHAKQQEVSGLEESIAASEASVKDLESRKRLREVEVARFEGEIEGLREHLKEARNNKEYAGFNTEIRGRVAEKKAVEDQVLEILEALEAEEKKQEGFRESIEAARAASAELEKGIADEVAKFESAISEQETGRNRLADGLDGQLRSEYDKLFDRYEGEALAGVDDGACGGCWMTLSSGDLSRMISHETIIRCPSCGRILDKQQET